MELAKTINTYDLNGLLETKFGKFSGGRKTCFNDEVPLIERVRLNVTAR
ncbi:MAG: hypothetical protein ACTS6A_00365 [Candidatus Hodgkinia cicadicola]